MAGLIVLQANPTVKHCGQSNIQHGGTISPCPSANLGITDLLKQPLYLDKRQICCELLRSGPTWAYGQARRVLSGSLNELNLQGRVVWQIENVIQSHYDEETAPKYKN